MPIEFVKELMHWELYKQNTTVFIMLLADFDFELPPNLIAQHPLPKRSSSRLLCLNKKTGEITHHHFKDLINLLAPRDLLILNNTKVLPARLYAYKPTGGKVEILVERILDDRRLTAQTKSSKTLKVGNKLFLAADTWFEITDAQKPLLTLTLYSPNSLDATLEKFGQVPLPPYIKRQPHTTDQNNYQTIYATTKGAVAAPTAGLHFDEELLQNLHKNHISTTFITLHVALGTFQPVRVQNIEDHKIHSEYIDVPEITCNKIITTKKNSSKVIAVGTTSLRALETASKTNIIKPYQGDTNIFIYPGYKFQTVDALITNFHLPKTSLLILVSAFAGYENVMNAYQEAIKNQYRFYSYGDAMLIF